MGKGEVLLTDVGDLSECPMWAHPDTSVRVAGTTQPNTTAPHPSGPPAVPRYPFRTMGVGESFPVEDDAVPSVRSQASKLKNDLVGLYAVRRTPNGWRCFRRA